MLSVALRTAARTPVRATATRSIFGFSNDKQILGDDEQMAGRRKMELDEAKRGKVSGFFFFLSFLFLFCALLFIFLFFYLLCSSFFVKT
jgi:hypothetical protein